MELLKPHLLQKYGLWTLLVVHFFGVIVIAFADLDYFAGFTPFNLTLSAVLILGAASRSQLRTLIIFLLISFSIGFGVEVLGTQTGFPFGTYWYLDNLGLKWIEVPLIIGINWFLLAYSTALWSAKFFNHSMAKAMVGASLMVSLDFFIEPLSKTLGFWAWEGDIIPWQNYLAWWIVAFVIHLAFAKMRLNDDNPLARWYLPIIAAFFIMLNILL